MMRPWASHMIPCRDPPTLRFAKLFTKCSAKNRSASGPLTRKVGERLGCGSGIPVARDLAASGYRITGVDISEVQVSRARQLVSQAEFIQADMTSVVFSRASFAAVVSFFALIHLPLEDQFPLLERIASWLVPDGVLVVTTGYWAWTGAEDNWLEGGVPMWWSHADVATYRSWINRCGFLIEREEFVPEGEGGHALFWARRVRGLEPPTSSLSGKPGDRIAGSSMYFMSVDVRPRTP
jgi:SAM-dependent methyltransferase